MFAFFGQSGGKFAWSNKLNYMPPAVIYHNGVLWWCVKENGTDTIVKEPGTDNAYWVTLVEYLHQNAKTLGLKVGGGVPIGTIIIWGYAKNPSEDYGVWLDCDGRNVSNYPKLVAAIGSTTIPNYRGLFLRGQGSQTVDGTVHTSPAVGTKMLYEILQVTLPHCIKAMLIFVLLGHLPMKIKSLAKMVLEMIFGKRRFILSMLRV